jgi:hypothetical protein
MRNTAIVLIFSIFNTSALLAGQPRTNDRNVLLRYYSAGETLIYHMEGTNDSWHYTLQANGTVKKDRAGTFFEEYQWSGLRSNDQAVVLSPASLEFRQELTLDPNRKPAMPSLSQVDPRLIGPITDLMTFYIDLWLAVKTGQLAHAGDHFYVKNGTPSSWADGTYVLTGESSIDFDLTLKAVNAADHTAVLLVHHVPPEKPQIHLRAEWMRAPVAETPNNWVGVTKAKDGKYLAAVGKETFDVEITVSLTDGKILAATMDNPVQTIQRQCEDEGLTKCGAPTPQLIHRKIEIALVH